MKNGNFIAAALVLGALVSPALAPASAQTALEKRAEIEARYGVKDAVVKYDTRADMMKEPYRTGAEYFMYPMERPEMTAAPKGYKPFYISYTGRHGARYAIKDEVYEKVLELLRNSHDAGKLTEAGEDLYRRYEVFYPNVAYRGGDLTSKGQEQLHFIANTLYHNFPEVFKGRTRAEVLSTPVPRVLLTMVCFLDEIRTLDDDFGFTVDTGRKYLPVLEPNGSKNPYRTVVPATKESKESAAAMKASRIDAKGFCSRYFNDVDSLERNYGMFTFEDNMRSIVMDIQCLDEASAKDNMLDIFTPEELFNLWEVRNYNGYLFWGFSPLADNRSVTNNAAILKDIMEKAEKNFASGEIQMDLRFTHDTAVLPLVSFMRLNNFGAVVNDPDEVKNYWRSDQIPMASNLQLIFFRSKKNPEILVKVLYNGHEAMLPLPEAAPSFYPWSAFNDFYGKLVSEIK